MGWTARILAMALIIAGITASVVFLEGVPQHFVIGTLLVGLFFLLVNIAKGQRSPRPP